MKNILPTSYQNQKKYSFLKDFTYSNILIKNCGFDETFLSLIHDYLFVLNKNSLTISSNNNNKIDSTNSALHLQGEEEEIEIEKECNNKKRKISQDSEEKESSEIEELIFHNLDNNNNNHNTLFFNKYTNNVSNNKNNNNNFSLDELVIDDIESKQNQINQIIKAYRSKHKSKNLRLYEINSINAKEKNKHKLFHKCVYPGCNRTFSSSGWLKAHFKEHLNQVHNSIYSKIFEKFIYRDQQLQLKQMTMIKNNNFILENNEPIVNSCNDNVNQNLLGIKTSRGKNKEELNNNKGNIIINNNNNSTFISTTNNFINNSNDNNNNKNGQLYILHDNKDKI